MRTYTGKEIFQILLKNQHIGAVVDDWVENNVQADLRIRRAKTPGHTVIETNSVMFANNIRRYYPNCQVNIKEPVNIKES